MRDQGDKNTYLIGTKDRETVGTKTNIKCEPSDMYKLLTLNLLMDADQSCSIAKQRKSLNRKTRGQKPDSWKNKIVCLKKKVEHDKLQLLQNKSFH